MPQSTFLRHEARTLKEVIMCSPTIEYFLVDDKKKHNITEKVSKNKAISQHNDLVKLIEKFGAKVLLVRELPGHPNSVFTQDTAVSTPDGYVKLRMGIPSREGEEIWISDFLRKRNIPEIATIVDPGTVEGGDVILAGGVAFLGVSTRTNDCGALQMKQILEREGFDVRLFHVPPPFLHLGGAMSVIDENTVLCVEGIFPQYFFADFKTITIPSDGFISGNVITLGNKQLIANKNNLNAIQKLKKAGFIVWECDLSEFTKGTGGPSCLIMPLIRA